MQASLAAATHTHHTAEHGTTTMHYFSYIYGYYKNETVDESYASWVA